MHKKSKRYADFYLLDALVAINLIQSYAAGFATADDFLKSVISVSAVCREFEVIGEAIRHILASPKYKKSAPVHWRKIVDFRNILAHEYFLVDYQLMFSLIRHELADLETEILTFIDSLADKKELSEALETMLIDLQHMHREQSTLYLLSVVKPLL